MTAQPQISSQSLEQRLYELLQPFRDDSYSLAGAAPSSTDERKCLVLCENIAFLIRHNQNSYGKPILASDVSLVSRHYGLLLAGKADKAGVGIFVIGSGYTHNVMRVHVGRGEGEGVVDRLTEYVDKEQVQTFFPEL